MRSDAHGSVVSTFALDRKKSCARCGTVKAVTSCAPICADRTRLSCGRSTSSSSTHIFIAFLAYCLYVTLCVRLKPLAPGLTPTAVLDKHPLPACVGTRCFRESNGLNACSRLPHCYRAICRVHLGAAPDGADGPRSYSL